jgi:glycopeptide antibiotics resistance protein
MIKSAPVSGDSTATAILPSFRRGRCLRWVCLYALAIIYVSVVLGPNGVNFVPRDAGVAWRMLLATPYLATGSDQRPDWMANLLMLVPLGFLTAGALWPDHGIMRRTATAATALLGCILFVVAVKYAQLFFPPRTVSLNYILAQSLGSIVGIALFCLSHDRLAALRAKLARGGDRPLIVLCSLYALGYLFFLLFPFDFALSGEDLRQHATALPQLLLSWPGARLPPGPRLILPLAEAAATIPIGVLLASARRRWPLGWIALAGFLMMAAATVASMFLLDATPTIAGLAFRTAGIVIGGALARRLTGSDPRRWHERLAELVPWLIAPYLVAVLYVKNLLSPDWRTVPAALTAFDSLGLLPFYHFYIVTKAHAAQSVAMELICFGPIGVMIALRRGGGRGSIGLAAVIALGFSLAVEFGRWLKPGLQPDFSNPIVAAFGAGLAVGLTVSFWRAAAARPTAAIGPHKTGSVPRNERVGRSTSEAFGRQSQEIHPLAAALRLIVLFGCLATAGIVVAEYPLAPWLLGAALALYAAALWRWPSLWLAVLPALLPTFDLAPWTGWIDVGEPDLFALVTIGILALRASPRAADFRFRGLAATALILAVSSCFFGVALGLGMPGPPGGSDNPYLRPDNALRVAKGLVTALALLPFLRERLRRRGDALTWFGAGMTVGLAGVVAAAIVERALFPGIFDFAADYRVAATFAGMHVGGGYIGAYIVLALPFLLVCQVRARTPMLIAAMVVAVGAGYALVVTFARAAYVGASVALVVACLGWGCAARRGNTRASAARALPALLLVTVGGIVVAGILTPIMAERLGQASPDLAGREASWRQGLALRDDGVFADLFGMGLGTFPRVVLARKPDGRFPTNFVLGHDGGYRLLSLAAGSPLYFGQKVPIEPGRTYRLFLGLRSSDSRAALTLMLCEKWLLYSDNCRSATVTPRAIGKWEDFGVPLSSAGLARPALFGWLRRPAELSVVDLVPGTTIDLGDVRMLDDRGHELLANGDFLRGTEGWYFTDDNHLAWRIENQYVMTFFEGGVLGLAAFVLLAAAALLGAARGIGRGEPVAACVAASLAGFLVCCMFDCLLDAPRLATLFYLVAFCGLTMLTRGGSQDPGLVSA